MRAVRVLRPALALALAATAVATPAFAKAKPKPVCKLVLDIEGDAHRRPVTALPVTIFESAALDITSADVASGAKTLVAVVRVKTTDVSSDPYAPLGYGWSFNFRIMSTAYSLERRRSIDSNGSASYKDTFTIGTTSAALPAGSKTSMDATSYTWVIPRSAIPGFKKKSVLTGLQAVTSVFGGNADAAGTAKTYLDLTPSCVKAS
jgi:hypothetical protein